MSEEVAAAWQTIHRLRTTQPVLLVQDTTSFDFGDHPATQHLGPLENDHCRGFLAHTTLAVRSDGLPVGVVAQQCWVRDAAQRGQSRKRHERAFRDKESYKWVLGLQTAATNAASQTDAPLQRLQPLITVCDREAHIYDFAALCIEQGIELVVRAMQARSLLVDGQALFDAVARWPVRTHLTLELPRQPQRTPRTAVLALRYGTVVLKRPKRCQQDAPTLCLQVVELTECNPPSRKQAVHWLLLTTLPLESVADAQQVVAYYTQRWLIERLHYLLKSGCRLEASQLRDGRALMRLLALYTLVAMRLLALTYAARVTPDASCEMVLSRTEWRLLVVRCTGQAPSAQAPPPSVRQVVRWLAQLGGYLGRTGDSEPGVKVLWRGWQRFSESLQTYYALQAIHFRDVGNA